MNKILSFTSLDFYTLKPYKKSLLLLISLAVVFMLSFKSITMICFYIMFSLIMTTTYPFSIGETNRLDTLYAALPLRKRDIVVGRYVFALCLEAIAALLILVISAAYSVILREEIVASDTMLIFSIAALIYTAMVSFQYPVYFKLGYNKAKFLAYIPMLLIFLFSALVPQLLKGFSITEAYIDGTLQTIMTQRLLVMGLSLAIGHLLLAVSCIISCRLYKKRSV